MRKCWSTRTSGVWRTVCGLPSSLQLWAVWILLRVNIRKNWGATPQSGKLAPHL